MILVKAVILVIILYKGSEDDDENFPVSWHLFFDFFFEDFDLLIKFELEHLNSLYGFLLHSSFCYCVNPVKLSVKFN